MRHTTTPPPLPDLDLGSESDTNIAAALLRLGPRRLGAVLRLTLRQGDERLRQGIGMMLAQSPRLGGAAVEAAIADLLSRAAQRRQG